MKLRRKFSLDRVHLRYETVDFEVDGESLEDCAKRVDLAFSQYCTMIKEKKIQ